MAQTPPSPGDDRIPFRKDQRVPGQEGGVKPAKIKPGEKPTKPRGAVRRGVTRTRKMNRPKDVNAQEEHQLCGSKLSGKDGVCKQPAGYGTDHEGYGRCKHHAGNTPAGKISGARAAVIGMAKVYGTPRDIDPYDALLEEVQRSAGIVTWMDGKIAEMQDTDLIELTKEGHKPAVWVDIHRMERAHLARCCKMAIDAGIAERTVRLAEDQGRLLAAAVQEIVASLPLSASARQKAPAIIARVLREVPIAGDQVIEV